MNANRLIDEKSPYLLQHAHNPVDWHPWSEEAFEKAKKEDRPIFLSIGYATCHWCHVMEKESFEDKEAARYLNETFIPIKVDREERPDIDAVYMTACQMLNGSGGWPLTIFMTPDKKPFFAGTYIPKRNRMGQPGLIDICGQVQRMWKEEREKIFDAAKSIGGHLEGAFNFAGGEALNTEVLDKAFSQIEGSFDSAAGGFGGAPKFPTPHKLLFLLRHHHRTGNPKALEMVEKTLAEMRLGGIWDHVGFGFHRYSTDKQWLLPHFEKMLYDQALMAAACIETYQVTGNEDYAGTAAEIFTYVLRDMTAGDGPFYAAEDADSEGEEGRFYVWSVAEFREILGKAEAEKWEEIFNLTPEGNFAEEATGKKIGVNIPHLTNSLKAWAGDRGEDPEELRTQWEEIRQRLFAEREKRVHPLKDDKVLTDWNGLMIHAMALGGRILKRPEYIEAAQKAAGFILKTLRDDRGRLLHRFRDGEAKILGHADDYAFLIRGLLELHRATFHPEYLKEAVALQEIMVEDYWDTGKGGFFLTAEKSRELPVRPKELYDGAQPSANSTALLNLLRLARLTGNTGFDDRAEEMIRAFGGTVAAQPTAFTYFLMGVDFAAARSQEVVIAGEMDNAETGAMLEALNRGFYPHQVVLLKSEENAEEIGAVAEYTRPLKTVDGKSAAYVCTGFACSRPVTDAASLAEQIG